MHINKILLLVACLSINLLSQSNSSYTRFGIGDIEYATSSRIVGIGQLGTAVIDDNTISTMNPASWFRLKGTRFSVDLAYTGLIISNENTSSFYSETDFKGFTFGFPVSEDYGVGIAAGLIPYSRINYKVNESITGDDPYTVNFEGKGGLSELFIGSSVILPGNIAFGASLNYHFGNFSYLTKVQFTDESKFPSEFEKLNKATGFGTTLGLLSPDLSVIFGEGSSVSNAHLGVSLKLIPELDADTLYISRSFAIEDTMIRAQTNMKVPYRITTGLSFNLQSNYRFNFDYSFQPWSEYELGNKKQSFLRDMHKISTGFEYKPGQIIGASTWEQIIWRAGLSYEKTQYLIYNEGIDQFSMFGGFSFPLGIENSIDVALQYSLRGTTNSGLLKENIFKLNFGISFGEIWFLRYDY